MNISVALAIVLLIAVIYIPGVNTIFGSMVLNPMAWLVIVPLSFIPFAVSEIMKLIRNSKK